MNIYFVQLKADIGGYEKQLYQLVEAADEEAAGLLALRAETHNNPRRPAPENGEPWYDDYMLYEVDSVELLDERPALIFRSQFPLMREADFTC